MTEDSIAAVVTALLEQHGGLAGIVHHLTQQGLGKTAQSWVSPRANLPICATQVAQAFGFDTIRTLAAERGLYPQDWAAKLAHALPATINQLTPQGVVSGVEKIATET